MTREAACLMNKNLRKWMPRILVFWVALTTLLPFFVSVFIIPTSSNTSTSSTGTLHQQHRNQGGDAADEVGGDITTTPRSDTISNVCLTRECIHSTASRLARAYPDKTNRSAWIINSNTDNRSFESNATTNYNTTSSSTYCAGIIYVKNFKAASSTAAGIALRIAYRYSSSSSSSSYSSDYHSHSHAWVKFSHVRGFKYAHRDVPRSILFTSLRDPAARAISRIFYTSMTQMGELPTDENILQKLRWNHRQYGAVSHQGGGYQVRYCSMHKELPTSWSPSSSSSSSSENGTNSHNIVINPAQVERNVQEIIDAYDFIMVAERMDESVVALALILGLEDSLGDVLVMDAKQNTATAGGGKNNSNNNYLYFSHRDSKTKRMVETCRLSVPAFRSPAVQAHLQSIEWYAKNYGDYLLHAAALQSLDRTIARLGNERFESALTEYRRLKQKAQQQCSNETISHCSSNGTIQRDLSQKNCYSDDSGCGHECIDRMLLLLAEDAKKGRRQQTTTTTTTTTNKKRKF